jgi:2-succinyl-6-hydroxy-2,4-cyclohexadiene-1-carboxylate synthase
MSRVAVDGVWYEVRTGGHGPAVLLLHGFTGRGSDWAPVLAELRRSSTTLVVDLLGHGRSDAPSDPMRHAIERQALDIAELLHRFGVTSRAPATVIGYSLGARVAVRIAVDRPDLVDGLILESPSAGFAEPDGRAARRAADACLADTIERDGLAAFVTAWEAAPVFASERRLPESTRARIRASRLRNDPAGLAASLRGAGQGSMKPLHDRLHAITCPTLIVAGKLDPTGVERARVVAAGIEAARLVVLPDRGHAPHRESPAAFRRLITTQIASWRAA